MTIHKFSTGVKAKAPTYSPHMIGYWKCDDGSGNGIRDYSGNGNDLSPLNAPRRQSGVVVIIQRYCTPTVPNGFYYECTTSGTTAATDGSGSWSTTPGTTISDGTVTWTCRAVPTSDFWTRSGWWQFTPGGTGCGLFPRSTHPALIELLRPTLNGNVDYSSSGISATLSGNHIDDAASGFPTLAVGDWIWISGFTGDTANNTIAKVSAASASQISFSIGGVNANAAASPVVRIRKVLPPPSILLTWEANTTMTLGFMIIASFDEQYGAGQGKHIFTNSNTAARTFTYDVKDVSATTVTYQSANPSGQLTSGVDATCAMLIDNEAGTWQFYKNGTRDTNGAFTQVRRSQTVCALDNSSTPTLRILNSMFALNGVNQFRNIQLYVGRNVPANLAGSTPSLIAQISAGTPLSATDWP